MDRIRFAGANVRLVRYSGLATSNNVQIFTIAGLMNMIHESCWRNESQTTP